MRHTLLQTFSFYRYTLSQMNCDEKHWRSFIYCTGQKETEMLPPVYGKLLKATAVMCLKNEALFWDTIRVNKKKMRKTWRVYLCWKVLIVLMWSGDLFSIFNYYQFSACINYPSMLHFKTSQKYLSKAPKHAMVYWTLLIYVRGFSSAVVTENKILRYAIPF